MSALSLYQHQGVNKQDKGFDESFHCGKFQVQVWRRSGVEVVVAHTQAHVPHSKVGPGGGEVT